MNKQEKIIESIWDELELSLTESGHPFHIFSIASINNGQPDARNVVLRGVERKKNMINFHTDSRSKKVSQLEEQADICALFYDKKKKVQLRVYGKTSYEKDIQKIQNKWQNSKRMSKLCYLNKYPPGQNISNPKDYLYDDIALENIDKGLSNFSIVNINIKSIDWLFLNHKGHERMLIELKKKDSYEYNWIAP